MEGEGASIYINRLSTRPNPKCFKQFCCLRREWFIPFTIFNLNIRKGNQFSQMLNFKHCCKQWEMAHLDNLMWTFCRYYSAFLPASAFFAWLGIIKMFSDNQWNFNLIIKVIKTRNISAPLQLFCQINNGTNMCFLFFI